jgi:hypothetical protein
LFRDCDDFDHESSYAREHKAWTKSRNRKKRYLLIQHDVDDHPHRTVAMMNLEREYGVRSNIFMFASRWSRNGPDAPYPIDHGYFQAAQEDGFVIGYHQNALQLSSFNPEMAMQRYEDDVNYLRTFYRIDYVVPHGGKGQEIDGVMTHNRDLPIPRPLQSTLRWVYNKHGLRFSQRVSDGGLRKCTDSKRLQQLDLAGNFVRSIKRGERAFVLVHPQRWGSNTNPSQTPLLASQPWYKSMCARHGVNVDATTEIPPTDC